MSQHPSLALLAVADTEISQGGEGQFFLLEPCVIRISYRRQQDILLHWSTRGFSVFIVLGQDSLNLGHQSTQKIRANIPHHRSSFGPLNSDCFILNNSDLIFFNCEKKISHSSSFLPTSTKFLEDFVIWEKKQNYFVFCSEFYLFPIQFLCVIYQHQNG